MEEQESHWRQAPACPKHPTYPTTFVGVGTRNGKTGAGFVCTSPKCTMRVVTFAPNCAVCGCRMVVGVDGRKKTRRWQCLVSAHKSSQVMEFCEDCDGTGWLHMDNRLDSRLSPFVIGVDGGMFVDACSTCDRFANMTDAELVHRNECGCGHGLPNVNAHYTWLGYPGFNAEIEKALKTAGFTVVWRTKEIIEVRIVPSRSALFTETLDAAHEALKETVRVKNDSYRQQAKAPSFIEPGSHLNKKMETNMPNADSGEMDKVPSKFTEEEIRNNGCRPLHVRGTKIVSTNYRGEPICFMEHKRLEVGRYGQLKDNIYSLLNQLNEMTFQDQPLEMQRRLESRRRAVLSEMAAVDPGMMIKGSTSLVNDRLGRFGAELPTAGGFEFSKLEKGEDEAVIHGNVHIDGHYFRAVLVEVHMVNGEQLAVNDPCNWFTDLIGPLNETILKTINVGGFTGDYVLCIYPGGR